MWVCECLTSSLKNKLHLFQKGFTSPKWTPGAPKWGVRALKSADGGPKWPHAALNSAHVAHKGALGAPIWAPGDPICARGVPKWAPEAPYCACGVPKWAPELLNTHAELFLALAALINEFPEISVTVNFRCGLKFIRGTGETNMDNANHEVSNLRHKI